MTISGDKVIDIRANPDSPVNKDRLCPKGAANYHLAIDSNRWTRVKYRPPNSDGWEDITLDDAMHKIAQKFQQTQPA